MSEIIDSSSTMFISERSCIGWHNVLFKHEEILKFAALTVVTLVGYTALEPADRCFKPSRCSTRSKSFERLTRCSLVILRSMDHSRRRTLMLACI